MSWYWALFCLRLFFWDGSIALPFQREREQRCDSFTSSAELDSDSCRETKTWWEPAMDDGATGELTNSATNPEVKIESWWKKMPHLLVASSRATISPWAIPVLTCRRTSESSTPPPPPPTSILPSSVARVWHWSHICQRLKNLLDTRRQITSTSAASTTQRVKRRRRVLAGW